jgi:tRNA(fMet)-specific endonuclease VapC
VKYLLDTNVVSALMARNRRVGERFRGAGLRQCGVSSISVQELHFGAYRSDRTAFYLATYDDVDIDVLDFDAEDGQAAGQLRARLATADRLIGAYDILIAGQALARDLVLVTHNVREFSRVDGLKVEDWDDGR